MSEEAIKILLVEDNPGDARLLRETFREITDTKFELTHVEQLNEAITQLAKFNFDAILLDLSLPDSQGVETVERVLSAAPSLPIIVLTGLADESIGIRAVRKGAQDYFIKGQTSSDLLVRAINYSIERKRIEEELRKTRDELEIRVKERTLKLEKAIDELRKEILRRIEAEKKIRADQEQLRSLTTELILTEERERRAIAAALHDSLGPLLAFSKRELGMLHKSAPAELTGTLNNIRDYISQAIDQTRTLTFDLSPPTLYTFGLEHAIEELTERFSEKGKLKCVFKNSDLIISPTDDIKIMLYRSVRELFVNIAKHAKAKSVQVNLSMVGNNLIKITVEDDGVGFDMADNDPRMGKSNGYGLFSIQQRLTQVGGQFDIQSRKGNGTKVVLLAPLKGKKNKKGE
jgi:signal transduction histidine kinase